MNSKKEKTTHRIRCRSCLNLFETYAKRRVYCSIECRQKHSYDGSVVAANERWLNPPASKDGKKKSYRINNLPECDSTTRENL
jgi:hypothetical protein